jgi:hypothetical protein
MLSVARAPIENRFKLKAVSGCWKIQEIIGVNIIEAAEIPVTTMWPGLFPKRSNAIRQIEETLKVRLTENQIRKIAY